MPWGAVVGGIASAVVGSALSDGGGGGSGGGASDGGASLKMAGIADDQWKYFKDNFRPLETKLITDVKAAGTKADQERAAGEAHGDISRAFANSRGQFMRQMAAYGVNPNSGRFIDATREAGFERAKADAFAQNAARRGVRDLAFGKQLDVLSLGRNIPATSSATLGAASAANTAQAGLALRQRQQNQYDMAPITSGISKGVSDWFKTNSSGGTSDLSPASSGFDFVNWGDNYG